MTNIQCDVTKCSVRGKISAIFETSIIKTESNKRKGQNYKVVTTEHLKEEFLQSIKEDVLSPTMKIDGTSCLLDEFDGKPWLWARHDVKPNKNSAKRFQVYKSEINAEIANNSSLINKDFPPFDWNIDSDFKELPKNWKSASGMLPSENGHLVGWVPINPTERSHIWHLSVVDLERSIVLAAIYSSRNGCLTMSYVPMSTYLGKTFELIGTNVNANPYRLGEKKTPFHLLIQHGEIPICTKFTEFTHTELRDWFKAQEGQSEGIVWHSANGDTMFKIHRHHLNLPWPVEEATLNSFKVRVFIHAFDVTNDQAMLCRLKPFDGLEFDSLKNLSERTIDK